MAVGSVSLNPLLLLWVHISLPSLRDHSPCVRECSPVRLMIGRAVWNQCCLEGAGDPFLLQSSPLMGFRVASFPWWSFLGISSLIWLLGKLNYREGKGHAIVQITTRGIYLPRWMPLGPGSLWWSQKLVKVVMRRGGAGGGGRSGS